MSDILTPASLQDPSKRDFMKKTTGLSVAAALMALVPPGVREGAWAAGTDGLEKTDVSFGIIPLTDCAPIVIAHEKGFFKKYGLNSTVSKEASWANIRDKVSLGALDGAHMLAGMPIAATLGIGATPKPTITAFSMDLNGNGITVSNELYERMVEADPVAMKQRPTTAVALKKVIEADKKAGKEPMTFAMVFPVSTHNYELRYWLASAGIDPDKDIRLIVIPPPQMVANLQSKNIVGYCVGEPWNQRAVELGIGHALVTDYEIWKNNPEKVFGVTQEWNDKYPKTHKAVIKALIRAAYWLDAENNKNRVEASKLISKANYVGADFTVIDNSMTGTFEYEKGDVRKVPDFNVFFRYNATYPYYSDAIWYLTQMRRWGQIPEFKPDNWYKDMAKKVYRPDIYAVAAKELIAEGKMKAADFPDFAKETGFKPVTKDFIDGVAYDGSKPNAYIDSLKIGLKGKDQVK